MQSRIVSAGNELVISLRQAIYRAGPGLLLLFVSVLFGGTLTLRGDSVPDTSASWFFSPIQRPPVPELRDVGTAKNPVDRFINAKWQELAFEGAPMLGKRALLRRLYFDLLGLPPEKDDIERFLEDSRPDSYDREVERLLASPRYGERWARYWMDVVRYADTDGFAIDGEKPTMWRYRDYVIRAFNRGLPFDQFIRDQLAGDEFGNDSEGLVATGFYRLGPWEADNMIKENKRQDYLNEITSTIGTTFLGLTVGCARCHDHKYDPISTENFYGLQAFVAPVRRVDQPAEFGSGEVGEGYFRAKQHFDKELVKRQASLDAHRSELRLAAARYLKKEEQELTDQEFDAALMNEDVVSKRERKKLETFKSAVADFKEPSRYASVAVTIANPKEDDPVPVTRVLRGGDVAAPLEPVSPHVLSAVKPWKGRCYDSLDDLKKGGTGRRKALADWISSEKNPLTARVLVNRIWQQHFGVGLVSTPNDFGVNGSRPSHPELLDYLAAELVENGWRLKPLHRMLVTSSVYRQSSHHEQSVDFSERDPDNRYLWRANFRRLEAEALRDAMLHVSGELNEVGGGPGYRAALPDEMGKKFPFFTWVPAAPSNQARRSVYMFQRRNMVLPFMESFDVADASESCGRRVSSVNATQVFMMFNSDFASERAASLARRVSETVGPSREEQVDAVFSYALGRPPTAVELDNCASFLNDQSVSNEEANRSLQELCLVVFNSNEFSYLE